MCIRDSSNLEDAPRAGDADQELQEFALQRSHIDLRQPALLVGLESGVKQMCIRDRIDTSDIPVLTDAEWAQTERVRGHLYRPIKRIVTARLDGDVLEWLKSHGRGYQSRMNAILRQAMLSSVKQRAAR